jgi:SAM-dependent methyltransferase
VVGVSENPIRLDNCRPAAICQSPRFPAVETTALPTCRFESCRARTSFGLALAMKSLLRGVVADDRLQSVPASLTAASHAATVDTKPWNAYYERPATLSLLPKLAGAAVLDAGCGSGFYAEYLLSQGAAVTAFDFNEQMVALTRARVGNRAKVLQADLSQPLAFAGNGEFDIVLCPLVMHYLRDWLPPFREFHRVLRPGGVLVFSTHHPFNDWKLFHRDDYFATELLDDEWEDVGKVSYYRRPLTAMCDALHAAGFSVERLLEPQPTEDFQRVDPEGYKRLKTNPWFLAFRARRDGESYPASSRLLLASSVSAEVSRRTSAARPGT